MTSDREPYCFMVKSKVVNHPPRVVCGFAGFFSSKDEARESLSRTGLGHYEEVALFVGTIDHSS